jgi:hypothetical protein
MASSRCYAAVAKHLVVGVIVIGRHSKITVCEPISRITERSKITILIFYSEQVIKRQQVRLVF